MPVLGRRVLAERMSEHVSDARPHAGSSPPAVSLGLRGSLGWKKALQILTPVSGLGNRGETDGRVGPWTSPSPRGARRFSRWPRFRFPFRQAVGVCSGWRREAALTGRPCHCFLCSGSKRKLADSDPASGETLLRRPSPHASCGAGS